MKQRIQMEVGLKTALFTLAKNSAYVLTITELGVRKSIKASCG